MWLIIWLSIAAILVIIEIATLGLTTIWFAGGALIAALAANFGANWIIQILVFAVVSLILLVFTRPLAQKHLFKNNEKTNVDSLVGTCANVIVTIDNKKQEGKIMLNGLEWSARAKEDEVIEEGTEVVVEGIQGVKAIVSKKIKGDN